MTQGTISLVIVLTFIGHIISAAVDVEVAVKRESKANEPTVRDSKEDVTMLRTEVHEENQLGSESTRTSFATGWSETVDTVSDGSKRLSSKAPTPTGGTSGVKDCTELQRQGHSKSGVYTIHPFFRTHLAVFCDMDSSGGGWTLLQMRHSGHLQFEQSWEDYVTGFGSPFSEHWLGLEKLHIMTYYQKQASELRIDLWDKEGNHTYTQYKHFWIDSERDSYRIHLSGYNSGSTGSDFMHACDEMKFSTPDRDNDNSYSTNCAYRQQSGWWFNQCSFESNLNAPYSGSSLSPEASPENEHQKSGLRNSLQRVEIKFRTPL